MMKIKNIIMPLTALSMLVACESSGDQFKMKKGDRVYLQDFPDSSYVANLDSILKDENVLDIAPKKQKQFTMSLADLKVASSNKKSKLSEGGVLAKKLTPISGFTKEEFAKVFLASMELAKNNSKRVFEIGVKHDGEKIESVLKRAYKTSAVSGVPKVMLKFGLSNLNPDLEINSLKLGQKIKLPKLK